MEVHRTGLMHPRKGYAMPIEDLNLTFGSVKVVKTMETTKEAGSSEVVKHTVVFDCTGVTTKAILDEAVGKMVIGLQDRIRRHWRKHGSLPIDLPAGKVTVQVANLLAGRSGAVVPTMESVSAAMEALSSEQIAEIVARYRKSE